MPENRGCGGCGFGFGDDCIWIIIVLILTEVVANF